MKFVQVVEDFNQDLQGVKKIKNKYDKIKFRRNSANAWYEYNANQAKILSKLSDGSSRIICNVTFSAFIPRLAAQQATQNYRAVPCLLYITNEAVVVFVGQKF